MDGTYRRLNFGSNDSTEILAKSEIEDFKKRKLDAVHPEEFTEDLQEDTVVETGSRIAVKQALKNFLSKKKPEKQATQAEDPNFPTEAEVVDEHLTVLNHLSAQILQVDNSFHCEIENVTGHITSSVVLSVYPRNVKKYREDIGSYQPVCILFSPSGDYKFQVFIHQTVREGKIDLRDGGAVQHVVEDLRESSGFIMCPRITDYDEIISDIRSQLSNVKEVLWPWRHVIAIKCKL